MNDAPPVTTTRELLHSRVCMLVEGNTSFGPEARRCDNRRLRILHAIHDFLPRHRAGSELYAFELCRALMERHHVTVLCASYDLAQPHGHVVWRVFQGVPVVEIVNNWVCRSFADTYESPIITDRIAHVLHAVQPDVVHVHSLLNLSFALPALARSRGIPVVATLHDYTLVCPSGGQRVHVADNHVCEVIDTDRCARCFPESPFFAQMTFAALGGTRAPAPLKRAAVAVARRLPGLATRVTAAAGRSRVSPITAGDIETRLSAARTVFEGVNLFVAPSASIASEFARLGIDPDKTRVIDYGLPTLPRPAVWPDRSTRTLRIGFVGTLVWHKGPHELIRAVRTLPQGAYELLVFGDPQVFPAYTARLRAEAAGLAVRFMGPFDREHAADVYEQIDVLVVPSLWLENSPLVIHEAFMAGIPVVGARRGGIADLVEEERTGLLYDATAPDALARTLGRLLDEPALLPRLTEGARTIPRLRSLDDDVREWSDIYEAAVQGRTPDGRGGPGRNNA